MADERRATLRAEAPPGFSTRGPGGGRLQRVRRRRRPDGRRHDAAPDHRRPRSHAARRPRRRGVDRQRLPDRVRRGHADRRPPQRRHRTAANVPRAPTRCSSSARSSSRQRRRSVRSWSAACSPPSAAVRWCPLRWRWSVMSIPIAARARSGYSVRSRRSAGCGVRCTARCSCGSSRGNGSSGSTSRSRSSGWPPRGGRWPITTGRSARHEIDWIGAPVRHRRSRLAEPRAARQRRDPERHRPRRADRRRRPRSSMAVRGRGRRCGRVRVAPAAIERPADRPCASSAAATCGSRCSPTSSSAPRS